MIVDVLFDFIKGCIAADEIDQLEDTAVVNFAESPDEPNEQIPVFL